MSAGVAPLSLRDLLGGHDDPREETVGDSQVAPRHVTQAIIDAGRRLDHHGWVPASAGNLSQRLEDGRIAITRSGCHKGLLEPDDIMLVDVDGTPLSAARPSAETLLHCQIYREVPSAGAVLHGHSVAATVLSRSDGRDILLRDYEVLKAFGAVRSHASALCVPLFDNDQDIGRLAAVIAPHFAAGMPAGYVIRGHGAYAWGPDLPTAMVRLEALEFLLACELEARRLQ